MNSDTFKAAIEARLKEWLETKQRDAVTNEARVMLERAEQLVLRAGKRSRPALLQLTYQAYGGKDSAQLIDIGLALELHHQFLLVHDDIMDNDTVRYDGPNITGYYKKDFASKAPEIPADMALLAGNLLFTFACQAILGHEALSSDQKVALLSLLQETNIGVHAGQQLDIVNIFALDPAITKEKLLLTDFLKTALYSINLPMQAAAELLQLDPQERERIAFFAKSFGVFYQLVDDHSDYFSSASSFNDHPKYRDYRQGKITYPLLVAFEKANTTEQTFLREYIGHKEVLGSIVDKVVAILEDCGAKTASKQLIEDYFHQAKTALDTLHIDEKAKQQFTALLEKYQV
jgi:geranylgeranyl pyrophosphate synthase